MLHVLTAGSGVRVASPVAGATRNDCKLTRETLARIAIKRQVAGLDRIHASQPTFSFA